MAQSYSKQYASPWLAGSWRRQDVLWWIGAAIVVPVVGSGAWWLAEKSYNSVTPYQVCTERDTVVATHDLLLSILD